ncbi:MAG: tryptophan synthase subunit alpha [Promethearchaeota archaeon]
MSRIDAVFAQKDRKAFIAYITVGYPSMEKTVEIAAILAKKGCDIIELGIPFSDPLADGATIQKASFQAIKNGVNIDTCFEVAEKLKKINKPLVFMSYYNPILNYGLQEFSLHCARTGIDGLIVPDLPPEESIDLESLLRKYRIPLIYLLSPNSTEERIRIVALRSRGFIYLTSIVGLTGTRETLSAELEKFILRVKNITRQPLCVGFGISTPEQAKKAAKNADGVIIGSRIIQLLDDKDKLSEFITETRQALDSVKQKV